MNPLPPQAYTKETMLKAYAWVMNQPPSIKELATTPDILVSLYLKAQRDGLDSLDRPSIQNFRDELKSLAGMMSSLSPGQSPSSGFPAATPSVSAPSHSTNATSSSSTAHSIQPTNLVPKLSVDSLDERSLTMIREVKSKLNLSNEMDSLRALIQLGFQALRDKISHD